MISKFEDILAWQKSKIFVLKIYNQFKFCKDFSFKDQILRAAVSIMNNIAEGFEKMSNKDFKKFLYISKGSCGEVRSMLYLAKELNYIDLNSFNELYNQSIEISKLLAGFIKSL
jgi:four helix bundle protein